jgi:SAM-dependent methyltransferase
MTVGTIRDTLNIFIKESRKRRSLQGVDVSMADPNVVYDSCYVDNHEQTDRFGRIGRLVPLMRLELSDTLLDVGCGMGHLYWYVYHKIFLYQGCDPSEAMIDSATGRMNLGGDFFYCRGFRDWKSRVDVITMFDLVEHITYLNLHDMFCHAGVYLRPGGRLYIYTPNADFILEKLKAWGVLPQQVDHIAVRSGPEYERMLREAGFENIKVDYISHYVPMLKWLHKLSGLPIIGKYFKARIWIEVTV